MELRNCQKPPNKIVKVDSTHNLVFVGVIRTELCDFRYIRSSLFLASLAFF